jgi:hypothetical protein
MACHNIRQVAFEALAKAHFPPPSAILLKVLESNPEGKLFWLKPGFKSAAQR